MNYKSKYNTALDYEVTKNSTTYLDMLSDEEYRYFYKIISADEYGHVTKDIVGNGLITTKEYNKASGHLNYISTGYNSSNDVRDISYSYDKLNNVVSKIDRQQNVNSSYSYDSLNRIASANIETLNNPSNSLSLTYSYDSVGNILHKSDVGDYSYTKAHQVTHVSNGVESSNYSYDENGNMIKKNNTDITYSSFNKAIELSDGVNTTKFFYAPNRTRYKKILNGDTIYYIGKQFEQEKVGTTIRYKNYIYAGGEVVAINIEEDDGSMLTPSVRYLHKDSLGSVDTITDESGVVIQRLTYKPFGERVVTSWKDETTGLLPLTKRGYTGHEHIKEHGLINMNARLYDPTIGRFLSADTMIPSPYDTQSYTRYSYVKNNPMIYTDPTGHWSLGGIIKRIKRYVRTIAAIVVGAVIAIYAPYLLASYSAVFGTIAAGGAVTLSLAGTVAVGAIAGFAGGAIMTGTLRGALKGAVFGAISAGAAYGVAEATGTLFGISKEAAHSASFFGSGSKGIAAVKAIAHGLTRGAIAKAQGQTFKGGFWSGFASSGFSVGNKNYGGFAGRTAIMSIVGGTASKLGGGKFANGAVSGAFVHMFNSEQIITKWKEYRVLKVHSYSATSVSIVPSHVKTVWKRDATVMQIRENYKYCENDCTQGAKLYEYRIIRKIDTLVTDSATFNMGNYADPRVGERFITQNPWTGELVKGGTTTDGH